jgi:hypothetical protein
MLTHQQRVESAKSLARVVICSFKDESRKDRWLKSVESETLNKEHFADLAMSYIKDIIQKPSFDLKRYKKECKQGLHT